jgi:bacterial/archaeal transporter family-2 protein
MERSVGWDGWPETTSKMVPYPVPGRLGPAFAVGIVNLNERNPVNALCIAAALIAGFALPFQAAANATLGKHTPTLFHAAFINFVVGGVVLAILAMASPARGNWSWASLGQAPAWGWIAGFIGAGYVAMTVKAAPVLGALLMLAAAMAGQMAGSLTVDHFGLMGMVKRPVSLERVAGLGFLAAGMALIWRGR